ncbi:hypothetical protein B0H10DRAFT_2103686 [Mycena sp. CBHHK59/15]|nr:hypothetical protein B0H10DRAFT_2103686 [Mycena sp. CBHHK59/15]
MDAPPARLVCIAHSIYPHWKHRRSLVNGRRIRPSLNTPHNTRAFANALLSWETNSRNRRKAQFSYLERRVSELEEENRQLRAGLLVASTQLDPRKAEEQKCEQAKARENEGLRERIKTLEKGWDEDPSERGRDLVSSAIDWRIQTAKWVADAQMAERAELVDSDSDDDMNDSPTPRLPNRLPASKSMTLAVLFGCAEKPHACKPSAQVLQEEEQLMQELAEELEDQVPADGAIEIDSEDKFHA